jgi:hypothetical protein
VYRNVTALPVFKRLDDRFRTSLTLIIPNLKPANYIQGELLCTTNSAAREVWFILAGLVEATKPLGDPDSKKYGPGDHFNEVGKKC